MLAAVVFFGIGAARAAEPRYFPADDIAHAPPVLKASLQALLDAYQDQLPGSRYLWLNESRVAGPGQAPVQVNLHFSPAAPAFIETCKAVPTCADWVGRVRFENLRRLAPVLQALPAASDRDAPARRRELAVRATLETSLVRYVRAAGQWLAPLDPAVLNLATYMWTELGNAPLALEAYRAILDGLAGEPVRVPHSLVRQADLSERLFDDLVTARISWVMVAVDQLAKAGSADPKEPSAAQTALNVMARVARIEQRLGRWTQAQVWMDAIKGLGESLRINPTGTCAFLRLALAASVHQAAAEVREPMLVEGLNGLLGSNCSVAEFVLQESARALYHGGAGPAPAALALAERACEVAGECTADQKEALLIHQALARSDRSAIVAAGRLWHSRLAGVGPVGIVEFSTVWALAQGLAQIEGQLPLAAQLMRHLNDRIDQRRRNANGLSGELQNLSRYDGLLRTQLVIQWRDSGALSALAADDLHGQRVLYKLRRQRWAAQYADVRDEAARSSLESMQSRLAQERAGLRRVPLDKVPQLGPVLAEIQEMMDDVEKSNIDAYYAALALKKRGGRPNAGFEAYHLRSDDDLKLMLELRLQPDEAYLSWLKVPGGYLAAVRSGAALSRQALAPDVGVFIPGRNSLGETIGLYRELLQAGAGAMRGARVPESERTALAGGLQVRGLPIWRLPGGYFVAQAQAPEGAVRAQRLEEIRAVLWQALMAPLLPHLEGVRRLIMSPDAELALLPFETLGSEGAVLIDRFEVTYVQSLLVYFELQQRLKARAWRGDTPVLSLADPVFAAAGPAVSPTPAQMRGAAGLDEWHRASWAPLPGTRRESDAVAALFPRSRRLLGTQASKPALMQLAQNGELERFELLHFATHGYVDAERSALVLSSAERGPQAYLFDEELASLKLGASLSILSACNSGVGRDLSGEGVVGLPYALFLAGNANTLMTLWAVDDEGTAVFIPAFLQRVQRDGDMVAALAQTKRAFARGDHGERFRDPRIWAPFVLYGASAAPR